jgi:peroxiredoxin
MSRIAINKEAPDFSLRDFNGEIVRLSDFKSYRNVILIFNRGFL